VANDDNVIDDAVVSIRPDTTGFKQKLEAQLKKALAGIEPTLPVKLVADKTGFVKTVYTELAKVKAKPQFKVKLVADKTFFVKSIHEELAKIKPQPEYKVKVTADVQRGAGGRGGGGGGGGKSKEEREAEKAERALYRRLREPAEKFEQGEQQAYDALFKRLRGTFDAFDKAWQDAHAEDKRRTKAIADAEVASVAASEAKKTKVAEQEAKQRARVAEAEAAQAIRAQERVAKEREKQLKDVRKTPTLVDFGGEGVRPMNLLYGAVAALTPALFAMGTSAVQAASGVAALGAAGVGAALGISALALSFSSVSDVLKLRTGANNAKLLATAKNSPRDQANSIRDLANAQRDEKAAYAAIHDARREAIRDLQDLRQAVIDLDNEYKSNKLSVAEAEQNEAATNRNFFATALDRARAHQDTLDARTKLSDTTLERKQKRQDLARSVKVGVEGSDKVLRAREAARDARDRRLDLQDRKSKNATAGLDGTSAAAAQLAEKIKELSPAGQEMYYWFDANDKKLKDLRRTIEQGTLPGFTTFLKEVTKTPKGGKSTLQLAAEYAGQLGGILGKYAGRFGKFTQTALFRKDMAIIQKNNATALDTLGKAAERMMTPLLRIFTAASPLLVKFADKLLDLATQFDTFIEKADKNGSLTKWFEDTAEQAKQWWRILVNAGRFLRDLFTGAKPAGGSLVTAFADYMERLANWSSSAEGQKSIKDFFDTIANLPYAQIRDMLVQLSELFLAKHVASWAAANPLFTAIGIIIAGNPALATSFLKALTYFVETGARIVSANPELTALVLAMVSLAKLNKATGGALFAVTGLDKLKDVLTGKFKVLDKFIGGASTSVMNVRAGVVNVYGASIKGGGGPGSVGGGLDFPENGKSKPGKPSRISKATNAVGTGNIVMAAALAGYAIGQDELDRVQELLKSKGAAFHTYADALTKKPMDLSNWYDTFVDNSLVVMLPLLSKKLFGGKTPKTASGRAASTEKDKFRDVQADIVRNGYQHGMLQNVGSVVNRKAVRDYIAARNASVKALVEETRTAKGAAAAKALETTETQKTATTLGKLLQQYGWTEDKARAYANQVSGLNELLYKQGQEAYAAKTAVDKHGNSIANAGKKAEEASPKIHILNDELDQVSGERKITFTTDGKDQVITDLEGLAARQQLIRQGKPFTESNIKEQKRIIEKGKFAAGGTVGGYSPHDKADNIPAMLTANEYVQPVAAVKHYGTEFMEAVRTRRFPKFATGGTVQSWPFPVKAPPEAASGFDPESFSGPDAVYLGKSVKGLGRVTGLGEHIMAAVLDAKTKFPGLTVYSGFRPGSRTVTGNASYHGKRRAVDLPPSMALFEYLKQRWGTAIRELIYSPANGRQVWNGKPHMFSAAVRKGHFNHVHLALAQGGQVTPRKFDSGGVLPPGYTLAFNGTGRNETVRTDRQERQVQQGPLRLDRRDITLLANAVNTGASTTVSMDGRRVAELTNRYNHLPAGV
jgi:hypothetical protein